MSRDSFFFFAGSAFGCGDDVDGEREEEGPSLSSSTTGGGAGGSALVVDRDDDEEDDTRLLNLTRGIVVVAVPPLPLGRCCGDGARRLLLAAASMTEGVGERAVAAWREAVLLVLVLLVLPYTSAGRAEKGGVSNGRDMREKRAKQ